MLYKPFIIHNACTVGCLCNISTIIAHTKLHQYFAIIRLLNVFNTLNPVLKICLLYSHRMLTTFVWSVVYVPEFICETLL